MSYSRRFWVKECLKSFRNHFIQTKSAIPTVGVACALGQACFWPSAWFVGYRIDLRKLVCRTSAPKPSRSTAGPPPTFLQRKKIVGFYTGSPPYLPKHGAPYHPDVVGRWSFANKKNCEDVLFAEPFPCIEQQRNVRCKKIAVFFGRGGYRRISRPRLVLRERMSSSSCFG